MKLILRTYYALVLAQGLAIAVFIDAAWQEHCMVSLLIFCLVLYAWVEEWPVLQPSNWPLSPVLWCGVGVLVLSPLVLSLTQLYHVAGLIPLITLIGLITLADTTAFMVGNWLKGPKLAPWISPRKTWSGALAAIVVVEVAAQSLTHMSMGIGALIASLALSGDLAESWLKRQAHVKDSGTLLGPHGGLLDRFDSYIFAAPAYYTLFTTNVATS